MCGTASRYEIVTSETPITPAKLCVRDAPDGSARRRLPRGHRQSFALPPDSQRYVAIRAIDGQGNIGLPAVAEYNPGPAIPSLGRCMRVTNHTGEYKGGNCVTVAQSNGNFDWQPETGGTTSIGGQLGAVVLETTTAKRITCSSGSSEGHYTGPSTEAVTITLDGCERPSGHYACQSLAAPSGEIVTNALEGALGLITSGKKLVVGLDLKHEPDLVSFECAGAGLGGKEVVLLEGSVIGSVKTIDKMTSQFTETYTERAGLQVPEQFESGLEDTLTTTTISGLEKTAEQAGLKLVMSTTNGQALEIKAKI